MFQLKSITAAGIPRALEKAERYRLLNEPSSAESICLDVLEVDPGNQPALVALLLARTDQFAGWHSQGVAHAQEVLPRITDEYRRTYYAGLVCERWAKAQLARGVPGGMGIAADWLHRAMALYEQAEAIRPAGVDEAILRWNTCARMLMRAPEQESAERDPEPSFGE